MGCHSKNKLYFIDMCWRFYEHFIGKRLAICNRNKERKELGLKVRMKRFENNFSQEQLSEYADLHPTYLSSIERGKSNPTFDKIIALARALKCSPKDFMPEK